MFENRINLFNFNDFLMVKKISQLNVLAIDFVHISVLPIIGNYVFKMQLMRSCYYFFVERFLNEHTVSYIKNVQRTVNSF